MGFGRTGKAVATVLLESKQTTLEWVMRRSTKLSHRSVPEFLGVESDEPALIYSTSEMSADELLARHPVDAIIDFSSAEGLDYYGEAAAACGTAIVSAISAYSAEKLEILRQLSARTRVLYSPNITIGINFLILAAKVLKTIAPHVDIEIVEEHFKAKSEVSGTAKVIARNLAIADGDIKSVRAGGIIGVHEILFGFPHQTVRLRHESIGREAFGNGVIFAVNNLPEVSNGYFTLQDLLKPFFLLALPAESRPDDTDPSWMKIAQ